MAVTAPNGKIVLVSGINGYIASTIGLDLLKKGYTLRGTLRSYNSVDALMNGAYRDFRDRVQLVIVSDIVADGAFDEVVKGVTAIIHTASPISRSQNWDDVVVPATHGCRGILNSAYKNAGPQLEAFVLTSSVAAVADPSKENHEYTEDDWNVWAETRPKDTRDSSALYRASKTLAERGIWEFADTKKPSFSISAVLPGVVTGPPVQPPLDPADLNLTIKPVWTIFSGSTPGLPSALGRSTFIDVRDVSAMHIWCAEHPSRSNRQRYLLVNGRVTPQATADLLRKWYPDRKAIPVGNPGADYLEGYRWYEGGTKISSAKAREALGREFIGFEQCTRETVEVFERVYASYLNEGRS